jgi:formylglycine-generating enzyme required for sulfatase activity
MERTTNPVGDREWYVNSVGITMVKVPRGLFERKDQRSEHAQEQVVEFTREVYISDREVPLRIFREFVDAPHPTPFNWAGPDKKYSPGPEDPVTNASWIDAVAFCNWLSGKEALKPCYEESGDEWTLVADADGYRLPTEAEWEYACRAGTATKYTCGDASYLSHYAVCNAPRTEPCGSKMPNCWGLFDMHGNVWEWCQDWYGLYPGEDQVTDYVLLKPNPAERYRVMRGGSFYALAEFLESAYRYADPPEVRHNNVGFRLARNHR